MPPILLAFSCALLACGPSPPPPQPTVAVAPPSSAATARPAPSVRAKPVSEVELAQRLREAFQHRDGATIAKWSSREGVRFSPYAFVEVDAHRVLRRADLVAAFESPTVAHWGTFDGSGEPIDLSFSDYVDRFVVPIAFDDARIAVHHIDDPGRLGTGNTIDNIPVVYRDAAYWVEFYVPGRDPAFGGMDWLSLRMVFVTEDGGPRLRAVVHDEWTT